MDNKVAGGSEAASTCAAGVLSPASPGGGLPLLGSARRKAVFVCVMGCAVFFIPYLFPVAPSVGMSYLTGFNNRVAFLLFALGSVLFAYLTKGNIGERTSDDQSLGLPSLFASLGIALSACLLNLFPFRALPHGVEPYYALNRLQMLLAGYRPYLDFEFAYGPSHLYVPYALIKLFACSIFKAFFLWWIFQWLVGVAMLWAIIRHLDFPVRHRRLLYWALFGFQTQSIPNEGIAYTPVRMIGAAFFLLVAYWTWHRTRRSHLAAGVGLLMVVAALAISPELGVGVTAGLLCWYGLLALQKTSQFKPLSWVLFAVGTGGIFLISSRMGLFLTLRDFAGGAYSYPLLPTLQVMLLLAAYLIAGCVAVRDLFNRNYGSMTIPLAIGGFAMLPAAMGRCDVGHLQNAAPAFLLGVAAIETLPAIRNWWRPLALYTLVLPIAIIRPLTQSHQEISQIRHSNFPETSHKALPDCTEIYRTPDIWPPPTETAKQNCIDTGYYIGVVDVFTPATIQRKIAELDRAPRRPILLFDLPLEKQVATLESDLGGLQASEGESLYHPRMRHQPLTYAPIFTYISQNYSPDPEPIKEPDGSTYRVWRPRNPK
jgi:hypothetical protein